MSFMMVVTPRPLTWLFVGWAENMALVCRRTHFLLLRLVRFSLYISWFFCVYFRYEMNCHRRQGIRDLLFCHAEDEVPLHISPFLLMRPSWSLPDVWWCLPSWKLSHSFKLARMWVAGSVARAPSSSSWRCVWGDMVRRLSCLMGAIFCSWPQVLHIA